MKCDVRSGHGGDSVGLAVARIGDGLGHMRDLGSRCERGRNRL